MRHRRVIAVAGALAVGAVAAASGSAMAGTGRVSPPASAPVPVAGRLGAAHSLRPGFFGVNFDYGGVSQYATDPKLDSQLAALDPGTLRYPGGTNANFFQWQPGYPVNPPSGARCATRAAGSGYRFTLAKLLAAYRATGAPPVFDLNVMTSTLGCQLSMLRKARQLGLPVRYVELGNEFYLSAQDYPKYFPTAADYGATVASYVTAVHSGFPGALVAAVGSLPVATARERTWNHDMIDAAAKAGGLPDAITLRTTQR
jgi:hypothetical protein